MTTAFAPLDRGTDILVRNPDRSMYFGRVGEPVNDGARIWAHEPAADAAAVQERPVAMVTDVVTEPQHAPVVAPELLVDPQDTEERFAALVARGRVAVVDLLTFLAPVAESVRDQSVTTGRFSALNHTGDTGPDLGFRPRWSAPPSGLERFAPSS